jgi:tetratricopeptide (TPR) repeat protein
LVAAIGFHFAERFDLAQPLYVRARFHAVADADEATLSALTHNMGWFHAGHALKASIFGGNSLELARHALAIFESAGNQDRIIGSVSLDALVPILRAQIASVQNDYALAIDLYESNLCRADEQGLGYMNPCVFANIAWCQLKLNEFSLAEKRAESAVNCLSLAIYPEDRMLAKGRLAQVYRELKAPVLADRFWDEACADLEEHKMLQQTFIASLSRVAMRFDQGK